ncbi:MAG: PilX N-terminal domain-containing pilus assembly protein [Candidatus Polarisedimenticolaceae bacterium]|nr:PilX N-terminal domain-containing pilus assembly protein [Candidatus Polarisedimenticolaceae bacterium]
MSYIQQQKQRGAVLIMVLLLLMVMTVLGVSGVGNSVLEEKMSANYLQNYSAEQSAEFGARVAGWWLASNVRNDDLNSWFRAGASGRTGLYSLQSTMPDDAVCQEDEDCSFDPRIPSHWCSSTDEDCPLHKGYVTLGTNNLDTGELPISAMSPDDLQPKFIIEYIGLTDKAGQATGMGGTGGYSSNAASSGELHVFKVTVVGWGKVASVRNVIQRNYYLTL